MAFTLNRKRNKEDTGSISKEELKQLETEMDTDNDGTVSNEEFAQAIDDPSTTEDDATVQQEVSDIDTNNDGTIDETEIQNALVPQNDNGVIPAQTLPAQSNGNEVAQDYTIPIDQYEAMRALPGYRYAGSSTWRSGKETPEMDVYHSTPLDVGQNDSAQSAVDQLTNENHKGVEARFGGAPKLPSIGIGGKGHLSFDSYGKFGINPEIENSTIDWDTTKDIIQSLGGGRNLVGTATLGGIQEDSFNPEVENPTYTTGHDIELPDVGKATTTSGPDYKEGSAAKMFHDIMSGKMASIGSGMPSTPNKVGGKKTSTLSKMGKEGGSKGKPVSSKPLKLIGKNSITQGKENIYERIVDKVNKNYMSWPSDGESHIKEKGTIAIYARKDWISVKYGSYRKVLLDTFAQEHPNLLPQIYEVVNN